MGDVYMEKYIADLMLREIAPSIPYETDDNTVHIFITRILDRFRNPYIDHFWKNIALNYTQKIKTRCIPILINHYRNNQAVPELFALGFAAYLAFMKPLRQNGREFFGDFNGQSYLIEDETADRFYEMWQNFPLNEIAEEALGDTAIWGTDLRTFPGFTQSVRNKLNSIFINGMKNTLEIEYSKKIYL